MLLNNYGDFSRKVTFDQVETTALNANNPTAIEVAQLDETKGNIAVNNNRVS